MLFRSLASLAVLIIGLSFSVMAWSDDGFPLRGKYAAMGLEMMELSTLAQRFDQVVVVDVRSKYEHETLRIADSVLIPLDDKNFLERIRELAAETSKPLVFYCSGPACEKSYQAALRARFNGLNEVFVFDTGVLEWAKEYPERTVLLGEPLGDASRLISSDRFRQCLLSPEEFIQRISDDPSAIVLDVRNALQRDGVSLLKYREQHVPLDNARLAEWVRKAREEGVAMYVIDASGQQVQWLQYFLEANGLTDYWFMEGGARAYFDMISAHR